LALVASRPITSFISPKAFEEESVHLKALVYLLSEVRFDGDSDDLPHQVQSKAQAESSEDCEEAGEDREEEDFYSQMAAGH
jgi:hypothetical protein